MTKSEFDTNQYNLGQRKNWDAVAAGWQKWWKTFEKGGQEVSDKLVELAQIKTGQRIVDIATGIGEPALTASRKVGNSGYVMATDISSEMLAIGKERARRDGAKNVDFKEGDAATVVLPSSSFDAALCRWGLMFLPNLSGALDNICRSLVSGGKFAAAVWSVPEKVPQLNIAMSIVRQYLQLPTPSTEIPGAFSLANLDRLQNFFHQARFKNIEVEKIQVTFEFDSAEDYVKFTQDIAAPVNLMMANETAKKKEELWKIITEKVHSQHTKDNGQVVLDNEAICVVADSQ
jgi:ubiquinone/menaquinone biosynthesis C-methylase UbiE